MSITISMSDGSWSFGLRFMEIVGIYSFTKSTRHSVVSAIYFISTAFIILMALMQFYYIEGNIFEFVGNLEGVAGFTQIFIKNFLIAYNKDAFDHLIETTKQFWKTDKCDVTEKSKLDKILQMSAFLQKFYFFAVVFAYVPLLSYTIIADKLVFGAWAMKEYVVLYRVTYILQLLIALTLGLCTCVFDCMFLRFCMQAIVQFKILCYCLKDLNVSTVHTMEELTQYNDKMKTYVRHHSFLQRFLKELQDFFSPGMVVQCASVSLEMCAELYVLFESNNVQLTARTGFLLICVTVQLAYYCVTAEFVTSEALEVSKAIYFSDWYSKYTPNLQKPIILLMKKSQKPFIFSAGGLFDLRAGTVLTVMKMAWSICTVMRKLKEG